MAERRDTQPNCDDKVEQEGKSVAVPLRIATLSRRDGDRGVYLPRARSTSKSTVDPSRDHVFSTCRHVNTDRPALNRLGLAVLAAGR